jgi:hypothetical protein
MKNQNNHKQKKKYQKYTWRTQLKKAKPKIISPSVKYDRDCDSKKKNKKNDANNRLVLTMVVAVTNYGF